MVLQIGEISDNINYLKLLHDDVRKIETDMQTTADETEATIHRMVRELGHLSHEDGQTLARTMLRLYVLLSTHPNNDGIVRAKSRIRALFEEIR